MKAKIDRKKIKRIINIGEYCFSLACAAYTIYKLIPKYDNIKGVDAEKMIAKQSNEPEDKPE